MQTLRLINRWGLLCLISAVLLISTTARAAASVPGRFRLTLPTVPSYRMEGDELRRHLRPKSDPVSAMIEGMALVTPLEYILSHAEVKIDVAAQQQWQDRLPIVRRVKLDKIHVIATYDPGVVHGGKQRQITLRDFAGQKGRTVILPADQATRIFVLTEE